MVSGLLAGRFVGIVAVGLTPQQSGHGEPLSWAGSMFVVAGVVLSFYCSVRLVTWLMVKIASLELSWEIHRNLPR